MKFWGVFLILALGSFLVVTADQPDTTAISAQVTALQQLIQKDEQANPTDLHLKRADDLAHSMGGFAASRDYRNVLNMTQRVVSEDPSDAVQKAVATLTAAIRVAEDADNAASETKIKSVLDDATQAIRTKTDPKDLDALIAEVQAAMDANRSGSFTPERQANTMRLQSASTFVKSWQTYLVDKKEGNSQTASNDLRNLSMQEGSFAPIPHSELLEMIVKEMSSGTSAPVMKIDLQTFADIPGAISQLEALQRSGNFTIEASTLMNALQNLETAYFSYQDKNYGMALQQLTNNFGFMGGGGGFMNPAGVSVNDDLRSKIAKLKSTLILELVQALLAMPDAPAPLKDEAPTDYVLRLAALKEKSADWAGLEQVLEVYQKLGTMLNGSFWLQEDLNGLRAYLVGEKLEASGQNLDAIRSYRQALATLGKFFPADPVVKKMDELQKKYPELYQQALQQPIAPGAATHS